MKTVALPANEALGYLDKFEFNGSLELSFQPPPVRVVFRRGMTVDDIAEQVRRQTFESAKAGMGAMLRQVDDAICERRRRGAFRNERPTEKKLAAWCGEIPHWRRLYTDREGNSRYLADEVLGLEKGQRVTMDLLLRALKYAAQQSYEKVARLIEKWTGKKYSPETLRRWALRVGGYLAAREKESCSAVFDGTGRIALQEGPAPEWLMLEADGCHIFMRDPEGGASKREVRLGLWYEGKHPRRGTVGNDEWEVTGKTYFGGLMDAAAFWELAAVLGDLRYGLGPQTKVFGGGDGGNWIGPSILEFENSLFVLCRYHWKRDIFRVFPQEKGKELVRLAEAGEGQQITAFIEREKSSARDEKKREKMRKLQGYLLNHLDAIVAFEKLKAQMEATCPALVRIGVIEGHIYQVLYLRFESRGGCWSDDGLNALMKVKMAELNGTLDQAVRAAGWLGLVTGSVSIPAGDGERCPESPWRRPRKVWREGHLPILAGPLGTPIAIVLNEIAHLRPLAA